MRRRDVQGVLVGAIVMLGAFTGMLVPGAAEPAAAATPSLTVTPSTLYDGDEVAVQVEGYDDEPVYVVMVCPAAYANDGTSGHRDAFDHCGVLRVLGTGISWNGFVTITDRNTPFFGPGAFTCSELPDGCVVAAASHAAGGAQFETADFTSTPVTVLPRPWTVSVPSATIPGNSAVEVTTSGFPAAGPGAIGLCPPDVTSSAQVARCEALATFPGGVPATATVTVPPQVHVGGTSFRCLSCVLAAWSLDPAGAPATALPFASTTVSVLTTFTATPYLALTDGQTITLAGTGYRPGAATVSQCPTGTGNVTPSCAAPIDITVDATGSFTTPVVVRTTFTDRTGTNGSCSRATATTCCAPATARRRSASRSSPLRPRTAGGRSTPQ